jgi:hypothetical protein
MRRSGRINGNGFAGRHVVLIVRACPTNDGIPDDLAICGELGEFDGNLGKLGRNVRLGIVARPKRSKFRSTVANSEPARGR